DRRSDPRGAAGARDLAHRDDLDRRAQRRSAHPHDRADRRARQPRRRAAARADGRRCARRGEPTRECAVRIAAVAIQRPVFAAMVILVPIVFGLLAYPKIGVEQFPSVEFPIVTVSATYPGADPSSMETKVARPIEDALSSMGGIKRLQSYNLESLTQVVIEFQLDVDGDKAVQGVRDRLAVIPNLPKELETPKVQKFDFGAEPIMSLALSGSLSPRDLTKLAEDVVKQ